MDPTAEAQFGEEDREAVDNEWDEFSKLVQKKKKRQEQAFYPCPPLDEDYVSTIVRIFILKKLENPINRNNKQNYERRKLKTLIAFLSFFLDVWPV